MKRKKFSGNFKAKVALAAIKGHQTVNEIAVEYGVHPTQVNQWKKQALEGMESLFGREKEKQAEDFESERDLLYQQIGKLQVETDWLKKKTGYLD